MDPYLRIKEIEAQMFDDASMADKLERFIRRGCSADQHNIAAAEIARIDDRLLLARRELRRIEASLPKRIQVKEIEICVAELNRAYQSNTRQPVAARPLVKFYKIESVDRLAA